MSWTTVYRVALHLLPGGLRQKHGPAMEALFERELERARAEGWTHGALAGGAGVWDVLRRAGYEQARPDRNAVIEPSNGAHMPQLTTGQLLRRLVVSFTVALVALTASLLALFARKQVAELSAHGAPAGTLAHVVLLAIPFTVAMTIPMAVFVAVLHELTRLRADGTLAVVRQERDGLRRLIVPVFAAATVIGALALVEVAELVPRANTRLATMVMGPSSVPNGRTMTLGELRRAEHTARAHATRLDLRSAAIYEVEIQKKFALPAACLVLALAGVAIALCVPRGGLILVAGASCAVFGAYYLLIMTGESLATRQVISPAVGMWGANAVLLVLTMLAIGLRRDPRATRLT